MVASRTRGAARETATLIVNTTINRGDNHFSKTECDNGLMFTREILDRPENLQARWLRIPAAVSYSGISRARLFLLLAEGQIRSASVIAKGGKRGMRIIDRLSIDEFLSGLAKGTSRRK